MPPDVEDALRAEIRAIQDATLRFDSLRSASEAGRLTEREMLAVRALAATQNIAQRLDALLRPETPRLRGPRQPRSSNVGLEADH